MEDYKLVPMSTNQPRDSGSDDNTTSQKSLSIWSTPTHSRLRPTSVIFSPPKAHANEAAIFYNSGCDKSSSVDVGVIDSGNLSPILPTHTTFEIPESRSPPLPHGPLQKTPPTSGFDPADDWDCPTSIRFGSDFNLGHRSPASIFTASFSHTRGLSDTVWRMNRMPSMYDAQELARPRSRSDAPVSPGFSQDTPDDNNSGFSNISQSMLSSGQTNLLPAPSAQRRMYPDGGVNTQAWSCSPGSAIQNKHKSLPTNPGQMEHHGSDHLGSPPGDVRSGRLSTIYDEDRATPGGIKLPSSGYHGPDPFTSMSQDFSNMSVAPSQARRRETTDSSTSSAPDRFNTILSGPITRGNGNKTAGSTDHNTENGSGSGSGSHRNSHDSSNAPPVAATPCTPNENGKGGRTAKQWAAFIMHGGYDTPEASQHSHSVQPTPRGAPAQPVKPFTFNGPSNHKPPIHTPFVLSQTVPHMNSPDPLVKSFIEQGRPTFNTLIQHLPFESTVHGRSPSSAGVLKVIDIPYSTTRQEIVAFFGRNARFLNDPPGTQYDAIHIIMERSTAKSMDCFVEFETEAEAQLAYDRASRQISYGARKPRIGDRAVTVHMSSQEQFMKELFPRAKCVIWQGHHPTIVPPQPPFQTGFQGFITNEEMHTVTKFASTPSRSRFATKHVQRTYESMISTLNKYPWWATDLYTVGERDRLHKATSELIATLTDFITHNPPHNTMNSRLLEELLVVGLDCPGFSEKQRAELVDASQFFVGVPRWVSGFAKAWPFEILRRRLDVSEELVQYYVAILNEQSAHQKPGTPLDGPPFGCFKEFMFPVYPTMLMSQVVAQEWRVLETMIKFGSADALAVV